MKVIDNICTIICLYEDDLIIFDLKIHVMNYVKSLFINNIDKKDIQVSRLLEQKRELFLWISQSWEDLKEM